MSPLTELIGSAKSYGFGASSGSLYWAQIYSGGAVSDYANDVTKDSSGNLYFTGRFNNKMAIWSLTAKGDYRWGKALSSGTTNYGTKIIIGSDGYLYVGGTTNSSDGGILAKYNTSGTLQWKRSVYGGYMYAGISDMTLDSSNNIYITGQFRDPSFGFNVIKFDSSGTTLASAYPTTSYGNNGSNGITVDSSGNIYVSGRSDSTSIGNNSSAGNKMVFAKFNSSLALQYWKCYDWGTRTSRYSAGYWCTQIGATGSVYVAAVQDGTQAGAILSLDPATGNVNWSKSVTGAVAGGNTAYIKNDGTYLYLTGYHSATPDPAIWLKFDTSGTVQLQRKWSKPSYGTYGDGAVVASATEIAMSGYSYINGTDYSIFTTQMPLDGSKTGTVNIGGTTYTYASGTATVATATPTVTSISSAFSSITVTNPYSITETTIAPTVTTGVLS